MKMNQMKLSVMLVCGLAVSSTGCFFGDSILSAGAKLASGQISQLTPGEIQILNQTITDLLTSDNPDVQIEPLTNDQASAVSNFLASNNLNTFEDFEALGATIENNPDSLKGLDELAAAFAGSDTDFDPDNFTQDDLDELLATIFGGSDSGALEGLLGGLGGGGTPPTTPGGNSGGTPSTGTSN